MFHKIHHVAKQLRTAESAAKFLPPRENAQKIMTPGAQTEPDLSFNAVTKSTKTG